MTYRLLACMVYSTVNVVSSKVRVLLPSDFRKRNQVNSEGQKWVWLWLKSGDGSLGLFIL